MGSRLFAMAVFPCVALGALVVGVTLTEAGVSVAVACTVVGVLATLVLLVVESWRPRRADMRVNADSQAFPDVAHYLVVMQLAGPIGGYVVAVGIAHLTGWNDGRALTTWPSEWPFALQVVVAWLTLGFFDYWIHRAYHSVDLLWWVHAVHHDTEGINVLKFGRVHALEGLVNGAVIVSLATVGVPWDALAVALAASAVLVNLSHANLDQEVWRPVHRVLPTVHLHRIHHARERALHDTNLGLPFYDMAFGTYTAPESCPDPEMGRVDPSAPTSFVGQLWHPVRKWSATARHRLATHAAAE